MKLFAQTAFLISAITAQTIPSAGDVCPAIEGKPESWTIIRDTCESCPDNCKVEAVALPGQTGPNPDPNIARIECACDGTPAPDTPAPDTPSPETPSTETPAPIPEPKKGDQCPEVLDGYTLNNGTCTNDECYGAECVIVAIALPSGDDAAGTIECGCKAPTPIDPGCQLAYDDRDYCKCPAPRPSPVYPDQFEVSVCGDATYLLPAGETPCSGPVDKDPAGTGCPKQGSKTKIACREEILSYITGNKTGECVASEDAVCEKLNTGAWGCLFPGNCNTVNTCTEQPVCEGDYVKQEDGTCKLGENGYPIAYENNTALVETADLTELQQDNQPNSGAASISIAFSTVAGVIVAFL